MTGGLVRAVVVWFRLSTWHARLRGAGCVCLVLAVLAGGGALASRRWAPRIVTRTETKTETQVVEHTVTVEKPVIQWRTRTVVVTKYAADGGVSETVVSKTDSGERKEGSVTTTNEKVTEKQDTKTQQETNPEGRWSVRALAGVDTHGSVSVGGGFDYRLVGPFTVGSWATVPVAGSPGAVAVGVSVGLRLP